MAAYTAIDDPEAYFQVKLYTGTGASAALTFDGDTDMQPDLVWSKSRSNATSQNIADAVRGVTKVLEADASTAEATNANSLTAFGSDGFTVGSDAGWNGSDRTFVAWCWKESATAGFDIVAYTGDEADRTIAHSLSAVPKMIIAKDREDGSLSWFVGHTSLGWTNRLKLDGTNTGAANTVWNDTDPTSSVFSIGSSANANTDGNAIIAYLFADVQGFSKFGSYEGVNNADGPFIYTGFRPAFILIKDIDGANSWHIRDNKRSTYNPSINFLVPDTTSTEVTLGEKIDILSNGFKIRQTGGKLNDAETYIYAAFAEAPFVNSNGVPCNAR